MLYYQLNFNMQNQTPPSAGDVLFKSKPILTVNLFGDIDIYVIFKILHSLTMDDRFIHEIYLCSKHIWRHSY